MGNSNFLLGNGERLVKQIKLKEPQRPSKPIYTPGEVLKHTGPQWRDLAKRSLDLPEILCPGNRTVFSLTLHPRYLSMSAYPGSLFNDLDLTPIGSRERKINPRKQRTQKQPADAQDNAAQYFVATNRANLPNVIQKIECLGTEFFPPKKSENYVHRPDGLDIDTQEDFVKIEDVHFIEPEDRLRLPKGMPTNNQTWEAVLHVDDDYVLEGLDRYFHEIGVIIPWSDVFNVGNLCFIPLRTNLRTVRTKIAKFSFLRTIRPMPKLRPIVDILRQTNVHAIQLPQEPPLDGKVQMAILDGGLPERHNLNQFVTYRELPGLSEPVPMLLEHGLAVTSAFLFGPLSADTEIQPPPCPVDHWRVLDRQDLEDDDADLFRVLKRIMTILETNSYKAVNLSLGPDLPIEDDEPHVWTAMLDQYLEDGQTLLCTAVGNRGDLDKESGNARVQPPSDIVNGLGIGASDRLGSTWERASYSCVGPGRRPGFVKPDILAFGGSASMPFGVIGTNGGLTHTSGTSFASPYAAQQAMALASFFERDLNAVALKALLIHHACGNGQDKTEVGWGKLPDTLAPIVTSSNHQAHIVYMGKLEDHSYWRLPIPVPEEIMLGMVNLRVTFCFATPVEPHNPISYTRAGLDIKFYRNTIESPSKPTPFFRSQDYYSQEMELRKKASKWESVMKREKDYQGPTLRNPEFVIHYLNRAEGHSANRRFELLYAAVITLTANPKRLPDLYNQIVNRYQLVLSPLRLRAQVQQRVRF